jgi:hypothetical protein
LQIQFFGNCYSHKSRRTTKLQDQCLMHTSSIRECFYSGTTTLGNVVCRDYSASGRSGSTSTMPHVRVPRRVARLVTRLIAPLVVDHFVSAARPGASARRAARHAARRTAHRQLL